MTDKSYLRNTHLQWNATLHTQVAKTQVTAIQYGIHELHISWTTEVHGKTTQQITTDFIRQLKNVIMNAWKATFHQTVGLEMLKIKIKQ